MFLAHYVHFATEIFLFSVSKENDIFLGWEKGTGKKWGKSKKKGGTDLSLEEMKKQAAVQCLRSASDEVSFVLAKQCGNLCSRCGLLVLYLSVKLIDLTNFFIKLVKGKNKQTSGNK